MVRAPEQPLDESPCKMHHPEGVAKSSVFGTVVDV